MKKFLFVSLCVLLLLSVGLVVASAEQVKAEAVTGSVDFGEMITYVMGEGENFPINIGGLINGILFASLLFLLSLFIGGGMFSTAQTLLAYTVLLLLSVLGGVLGMTAQKGRKKRRPRRR